MFQWMVRRWTKLLGQEKAIKLMMWNNDNPSFSLRFSAKPFSFFFFYKLNRMVLRCFFPNTDLRANSGKGVTRADLVMQFNMLKVHDDFFLSFLVFFGFPLVQKRSRLFMDPQWMGWDGIIGII
jgi:16S rRNA (cytosine967-C5)-methyltransferase